MLQIFRRWGLSVAGLLCVCANGEPTLVLTKPEALDVYSESVRRFLEDVPAGYDAEELTILGWGSIGPLPSVAVRVGKSGARMELDAKDGTVYFFTDSSQLYRGDSAQEPMETVLSADDAYALALPVLKHYGLQAEQDEYEIVPDRSVPWTVGQGRWKIRKNLAYEGMETLSSYVEVLVRAHTKRIDMVRYYPPVAPAPVRSGISREEAIEKVKKVVYNRKAWPFGDVRNFEFGGAADVTKVVAMPPGYQDLKPHEHPYHSRYFWKVPYSAECQDYGEESWQRLWTYELIDVETGKEIGEINAP